MLLIYLIHFYFDTPLLHFSPIGLSHPNKLPGRIIQTSSKISKTNFNIEENVEMIFFEKELYFWIKVFKGVPKDVM
jgi:hypothetical protein